MTLICKRLINSNDMNTQHTHPYKTPFNVGSLEYGVSEHPAPPHPSYQTAPPRNRREGGGSLFGGGGGGGGGPISDYVIVLVRVCVTFLSRVLRPTYKLIMRVSAAIPRGRPPGNPGFVVKTCPGDRGIRALSRFSQTSPGELPTGFAEPGVSRFSGNTSHGRELSGGRGGAYLYRSNLQV